MTQEVEENSKKRKAEGDPEEMEEEQTTSEKSKEVTDSSSVEKEDTPKNEESEEATIEETNTEEDDTNKEEKKEETVDESKENGEPEPMEQDDNDANADGDDKAVEDDPIEKKESDKDGFEETSYANIRKCIVQNDGTDDNMVKLIGLKNLFSKQLPKMPKDYIVRLVFDRRHKSLAILSDDPKVKGTDDEIIGGICYRAYHDMRFAEIAFCAVSQAQQVKVSGQYS